MASNSPRSFPYHDLDYDPDDEEEAGNVAQNGHLHLRFPQERPAEIGNTDRMYSSNPHTDGHRQFNDRGGDQLLLSDINGIDDARGHDDGLLVSCYDDDDALLTLEKEIDEEEDQITGTLDKIFDFLGKCFVIWPHPYCPGSVIILVLMSILTAVVGWQACVHYPPQKILDDIMDDASMGFETRGTYLRKAMATGERINSALLDNNSPYSTCPDLDAMSAQLGQPLRGMPHLPGSPIQSTKALCNSPHRGVKQKRSVDDTTENFATPEVVQAGIETTAGEGITAEDTHHRYFTIFNVHSYLMFVFENTNENSDMFDVQAIHALCDATKQTILPMFPTSGGFQYGDHRSITDMIQLYHDIPSCHAITQTQINSFRKQLHACGKEIVSDNNSGNVTNTATPDVECDAKWREMFYDAATFLIDVDFSLNSNPNSKVKYSALLVTIQNPTDIDSFYDEQVQFYVDNLEGKKITMDDIRLTAVNFPIGEDLKFELFQKYLVADMRWFMLALLLVVGVMLLYLLRVDLVIATLISICTGFMFAYAAYYAILRLTFFPFINILGLLILIAIGADDVFVFFDIFEQVRVKHSNLKLNRIISKTLSHAISSIFVTSFTTASAFYANAVSDITSIKLFGIFSGTAVLLNFFVMVLIVPSVIVIAELLLKKLKIEKCRSKLSKMTGKLPKRIFSRETGVPSKVLRYTWFIWIILLSLLGIGGCFVVFVKPRFQLPVTSDFQVFPASDCMENWYLTVKRHYQFIKHEDQFKDIKLFYIWGFKSNDPGDWLNPRDADGPLIPDHKFDFYDEKTQLWLYDYCKKTRKAKFTTKFYEKYICTFDAFEYVIKGLCSEPYVKFVNATVPQCCDSHKVPFSRKQLRDCSPMYQYLYYNEYAVKLDDMGFGKGFSTIDVRGEKPVYDALIYDLKNDVNKTNHVSAYLLSVTTKYIATYEYDVMNTYYEELAGRFNSDVKKGPPTVRNGFCAFTDWFWFYDLQHSLATGTYYSIGLSLVVAFIVMLVTSLNVVITIYAMVTITLAIACTVAVLVLMGWHLNVIESVIISISVGLSIDFAIHYGVAYRLSKENNCKLRTAESYERVGPAVAMAALTTFLAGAAMMPCHVLAYTKLGLFLMLVMTFAWIYSTLLFQSLCWIMGPIGQCCEVKCGRNKQVVNERVSRGSGHSGDVNMLSLDNHSDDDSLLVTF